MYPVPYKKNKMLLVRIYRNFLKTIWTIDHVDSCLNVMGKDVFSYPGFWIPKIDEKGNLRLTIHGQPSFSQKSFLSTEIKMKMEYIISYMELEIRFTMKRIHLQAFQEP